MNRINKLKGPKVHATDYNMHCSCSQRDSNTCMHTCLPNQDNTNEAVDKRRDLKALVITMSRHGLDAYFQSLKKKKNQL